MKSHLSTCSHTGHLLWNKLNSKNILEIMKFCRECGNPVRNKLSRLKDHM